LSRHKKNGKRHRHTPQFHTNSSAALIRPKKFSQGAKRGKTERDSSTIINYLKQEQGMPRRNAYVKNKRLAFRGRRKKRVSGKVPFDIQHPKDQKK